MANKFMKNCLISILVWGLQVKTTMSQVQWHLPVIPEVGEFEAGGQQFQSQP